MSAFLDIRPVGRDDARTFIREHHRHHGVPIGWLWLHGAHDEDGNLVGVAVCGRPVARGIDDGLTMEVTRLATDGAPNANSILYAAADKAATSKGYRRWLTYLLASEWDRFQHRETGEQRTDRALAGDPAWKRVGGAGLRAIGARELWRVAGRSWDCPSRPRSDKHPTEDKVAIGKGAWPALRTARDVVDGREGGHGR